MKKSLGIGTVIAMVVGSLLPRAVAACADINVKSMNGAPQTVAVGLTLNTNPPDSLGLTVASNGSQLSALPVGPGYSPSLLNLGAHVTMGSLSASCSTSVTNDNLTGLCAGVSNPTYQLTISYVAGITTTVTNGVTCKGGKHLDKRHDDDGDRDHDKRHEDDKDRVHGMRHDGDSDRDHDMRHDDDRDRDHDHEHDNCRDNDSDHERHHDDDRDRDHERHHDIDSDHERRHDNDGDHEKRHSEERENEGSEHNKCHKCSGSTTTTTTTPATMSCQFVLIPTI